MLYAVQSPFTEWPSTFSSMFRLQLGVSEKTNSGCHLSSRDTWTSKEALGDSPDPDDRSLGESIKLS